MSANAINGEHVVDVLDGFEIPNEGDISIHAKGCGGEERTLKAMRCALA
jgi:hypothetical protein